MLHVTLAYRELAGCRLRALHERVDACQEVFASLELILDRTLAVLLALGCGEFTHPGDLTVDLGDELVGLEHDGHQRILLRRQLVGELELLCGASAVGATIFMRHLARRRGGEYCKHGKRTRLNHCLNCWKSGNSMARLARLL